nr:MAG TPA: hypothetical protein [Bacteriophage sp.]
MKYRHISTICICILIYLLFFVYKTILRPWSIKHTE